MKRFSLIATSLMLAIIAGLAASEVEGMPELPVPEETPGRAHGDAVPAGTAGHRA